MRWVKIIGIVLCVILSLLIYNGQTTAAANIVGGIGTGLVDFGTNVGEFIGKLPFFK